MESKKKKKQIQLSVPNLDIDIVNNLKECIETGWVSTGGRFISEFEKKVADYVGTKDAVSAQSGTAGLHVSLRILGVRPGDEVIVPALTFVATVNPVKYLGAEPIFMDCDDYFCIDVKKLEKFLKNECNLVKDENSKQTKLINKKSGRQITAVVVVHVFGHAVNMEKIMELAQEYNFKVLEDAAESLGTYITEGRYKGRHTGTIGHIGVYSFNANKIITTGGGGMIVSRNQKYLDKARYLTITAKGSEPKDALFFVHGDVGYNYRMLNIQAALGVNQIEKIESFIKIKENNYKIYEKELNGINGVTLMPLAKTARGNNWFYCLYIDAKDFGESRDELMYRLLTNGIQCRPIWTLIHKLHPYKDAQRYEIVRAADLEANVLNIPCSTNLSAEDIKYVCENIKNK